MKLPWKTTGIVLTAPLSNEVDDTVRLIDEYLVPRGFNMIVLQVRYRYQFKKHPEVWGYDPLSYEDVKKLLAVCKKHGLGSLTPVESGGGSDSCYTQAAGIPSICGMGACGEFCHTTKEYALIDSISLRAKLLTMFLLED